MLSITVDRILCCCVNRLTNRYILTNGIDANSEEQVHSYYRNSDRSVVSKHPDSIHPINAGALFLSVTHREK